MTPQERKKAVRQAIVHAVPNVMVEIMDGEYYSRKIELADVLIAIKSLKAFHYNQEWWDKINALIFQWDLSQDFDHQSEAVWEFLWELLVDEK